MSFYHVLLLRRITKTPLAHTPTAARSSPTGEQLFAALKLLHRKRSHGLSLFCELLHRKRSHGLSLFCELLHRKRSPSSINRGGVGVRRSREGYQCVVCNV